MWQSIGLISIGAVAGAVLRWFIGLWFNPLFSGLYFGMLVANLVSCFLIGIFTALCWHFPSISEQWKLLIITGFFGSLSTISAVSAEFWTNFLHGKMLFGFMVLGYQLFGSLLATFLGILFMGWFFKGV